MSGPRERWLVAATEYAGLTRYTGGIGRHYAALVPALQRQGVDVDLVIFSDDDPVVGGGTEGARLVSYVRTDGMSRLRTLVHRARHVRRVYRSGAYDRVFLPEWAALGAALPKEAPLLTNLATGTRLANAVSGLRLRDLPWRSRVPVVAQGMLESRQIRRSAGVIAISTAMLHRVRADTRSLPPARIVRNCIDVAGVRAAAVASLPAGWPPADGPIVLFLGRAERRKGIVDAFAAFARLSARLPDARLVVAGAGGDARYEPTRAALLSMLPAHAQERTTWLGHVPGDELYAAIRAADVAMCPSRWEGFGNVALEVKTLSTPLIVTSGSGYDDFCVDGVDCLMVPPADAPALAEALHRALADAPSAAARAERGTQDVDRFAPDPVAVDLIAAADALLGASPRPRA